MDVSRYNPPNADDPIDVTLLGIVTDVSQYNPPNAICPIDVTPFSITTLVME
jgi:hypothetical protein